MNKKYSNERGLLEIENLELYEICLLIISIMWT
jgi:hypothetical protein